MHKLKIICALGIGILSLVVITHGLRTYDGKLHISFCDVGQGDAILIQTPGRQKILVDGGPSSQVLKCLDGQLPFWDRNLTAVILTHPHYDHFRGLVDVLNRYTVELIGQEDLQNTSEAFAAFMQSVAQEGAHTQTLQKGTLLTFKDGVKIEIMGPDSSFLVHENPQGITESENPPSLIIHVKYGSFDVLIPGDSDGEDLVKYLPAQFRPDVMALPHHGSENGFTQEVSKVLNPRIAIISSGKGNQYGHPHKSVLEHMKAKHTQVFRTDQQGTISMTVDQKGTLKISTQK